MLQLDWFINLAQDIWYYIGPGWQDLLRYLTTPIEIGILGTELNLLELMFGYGLTTWLAIKIAMFFVTID